MDSRLVLPVNTVLDGDYRILSVVGSGGFGITYEAEDINLRTKVAIKEYYPFDFGDRDANMSVRPKSERHKPIFEKGRTNFLQEARSLACFEHQSIVRVFRVFEVNSTPYMVMRFERGQSFEDWLRGLPRPPTQEELDRITGSLIDALEIMHAANFLHRDIAPDNIIIRTDGTPVLLDFGAARRAVAEMSRSLTGIVKAGYSPHEQYSSDARLQGPWSDFYALGGTLYRAVTGRAPEEATLRVDDDGMTTATQGAIGSYRPEFLATIDKCLKVRASERPRTVAQLRLLLLEPEAPPAKAVRLVENKGPTAKPPSSASDSGKVARRWPAIAAIATVLVGAYGGFEYKRWIESESGRLGGAVALSTADEELRRKAAESATRHQAALDAETRQKEKDAADARQRQLEIEEARRRKTVADAAEAEARRKAQAAAEVRRKEEARVAALEAARRKEEEVRQRADAEQRRIAALEEARRKAIEEEHIKEVQRRAALEEAKRQEELAEAAKVGARRKAEEAARLAVIPDDEKRSEFVRRVQLVLKHSHCYEGALNGRSNSAQNGLNKFVENIHKRGKSRPTQIVLAKATVGDFETWLRDASAINTGLCVVPKPAPPKVAKKKPVAKPESQRAETQRGRRTATQLQSAPAADSEDSGTRGGRKWGFRHGGFGGRRGSAPLVDPTP